MSIYILHFTYLFRISISYLKVVIRIFMFKQSTVLIMSIFVKLYLHRKSCNLYGKKFDCICFADVMVTVTAETCQMRRTAPLATQADATVLNPGFSATITCASARPICATAPMTAEMVPTKRHLSAATLTVIPYVDSNVLIIGVYLVTSYVMV